MKKNTKHRAQLHRGCSAKPHIFKKDENIPINENIPGDNPISARLNDGGLDNHVDHPEGDVVWNNNFFFRIVPPQRIPSAE